MRVAGIDCGTNSIRLLIAEVASDGRLRDVVRLMRVVRLGEDVDKTGRLSEAALQRTFQAVDEYSALISQHSVERTLFVATSASRDAENSADFMSGVRSRLGVEPQVITGPQEANFSFSGAVSGISSSLPRPVLVVDIGGGSTEFALGEGQVESAISVDMGCVRITERFLSQGAEGDARAYIAGLLDKADEAVNFSRVGTLVGVAGSVTTITAHALDLDSYQPEKIDGAQLSLSQVNASCEALRTATLEQKAQMGFMHPGRRDVISAGAIIWQMIVDRVSDAVAQKGRSLGKVITSEHDILDGITLAAASISA